MCPSLIQIGSKTAEKTLHKQTNKQTDKQTNRHYENNGHLAVNQKDAELSFCYDPSKNNYVDNRQVLFSSYHDMQLVCEFFDILLCSMP